MKITFSHHYDTKLCELNFGEPFELFGEFYILVNTGGRIPEVVNSPKFCCVKLTDGECVLFDSNEKVHPITAYIVMGESKDELKMEG